MFSFVTLNASEVIRLLLLLGWIWLIWFTVKTSGKRKAQLQKLLEGKGEVQGDSSFGFSNATETSKQQGEVRDVDLTQAGVRQGGLFGNSSDDGDGGDSGGD